MNLPEWIRKDLERSGLSKKTIEEMNIETVPDGKLGTEILKEKLGYAKFDNHNIKTLSDIYLIPYPHKNYYRGKLKRKIGDGAKYLSPPKNIEQIQHMYYFDEHRKKFKSQSYPIFLFSFPR